MTNKNGSIRLVVDCREGNALMRAPPRSRFGGPGALSRLDFSPEAMGAVGIAADTADIHISDLDLVDGFYQLLCPEVSSWFGVDGPRCASDWGVDSVWDEDSKQYLAVEPGCQLYFTMAVVSMGWTLGLHYYPTRASLKKACAADSTQVSMCPALDASAVWCVTESRPRLWALGDRWLLST